MKSLGWSCLPLVVLGSVLHAQQPASKLTESEKAGERLYLQRCALCHSGTAPAYATYGPSLDSEVIARRGDESVRKLISEGSDRMPGFRYSLEPAQIDHIIAFLKTMKSSSYVAEATLPRRPGAGPERPALRLANSLEDHRARMSPFGSTR